MITFKDFLPQWNEAEESYESIESVLERVNVYVQDNGVRVINIETLLLPNVEETGEADYTTYENQDNEWCQVIRLWYQE